MTKKRVLCSRYGNTWAPPGTVREAECAVCGVAVMIEASDGPTCFAMAMTPRQFRRPNPHDRLRCPNADCEWHEKAVKLVQAIAETPSPRVAELMRQDLDVILTEAAPRASGR